MGSIVGIIHHERSQLARSAPSDHSLVLAYAVNQEVTSPHRQPMPDAPHEAGAGERAADAQARGALLDLRLLNPRTGSAVALLLLGATALATPVAAAAAAAVAATFGMRRLS